jgi:hypothetical protein
VQFQDGNEAEDRPGVHRPKGWAKPRWRLLTGRYIRQGWESSGGVSPHSTHCLDGWLAYPMHAEGTAPVLWRCCGSYRFVEVF